MYCTHSQGVLITTLNNRPSNSFSNRITGQVENLQWEEVPQKYLHNGGQVVSILAAYLESPGIKFFCWNTHCCSSCTVNMHKPVLLSPPPHLSSTLANYFWNKALWCALLQSSRHWKFHLGLHLNVTVSDSLCTTMSASLYKVVT